MEKGHVSKQTNLEQEMIDRQRILDVNKHAQQLLHIAAKHPQDSDRRLIAEFPPTVLQLRKLYQKNMTPFIQARMLKLASTKKVKLPSRVGKVPDVEWTLQKLKDFLDATLSAKEDCLLLLAYKLCLVVELPLRVEALDSNYSSLDELDTVVNV